MGWRRVVLGGVAAVALGVAAAAAIYAERVLPQQDGTLAAPGLAAPVRIERDADGVPTLHATSLRDAAYALGVVHAQDRLWQLETHRRIGAGRLAEAFGAGALDTDRFLRALAVRRAATAQWAALKGEARELLEAYAQGVNGVQRNLRARPPEFVILGLQTEDWTPIDSLAWAIMMAWDLGGNWSSELLRLQLAQTLSVERIAELMPPVPGDQRPATADYAALYRSLNLDGRTRTAFGRLPALAPESGVEGVGSNNWVLAGSHTTTGTPLLANDPHLKLSAPALWYLVRIEVPGLKLAGVTMPGLPLVVLGQSADLAWGFTNTGPDVQDLYLERVDPADPGRVQSPEGWTPIESTTEIIKVKGRPDVPVTVRRTRHGPVISDAGIADTVLGPKERPAYLLALRWTALDADFDAVTPAIGMQRARSVDEFVAASRGWVAPMQNMVVADRGGRIGFVAPGRVPVRGPHHDLHGKAPAPGWDARYDWTGWVPADETPREFDPARGWIATANQRIVDAAYPHFLGSDWAAPYRQQRIEQVLTARPRHSLDDLAALQADIKSLAVEPLLPWLRKARPAHPLLPVVAAEIESFDGTMDAGRIAPLIFWSWARQLTLGVFSDEVGETLLPRTLGTRSFRDALEGVLARNDSWWCDDKRTPAVETCEQQNTRALGRALDELELRYGADPSNWIWGRAHQARSEHRPFSRVPVLKDLFELRTPVGGDTYTVNVSRVSLRPDATTGELFLDEHGPSMRALYDLGDPARSRVMFSSGQSGIVFSPRYRSFVKPWAAVQYRPLWSAAPPAATLQLVPAALRP